MTLISSLASYGGGQFSLLLAELEPSLFILRNNSVQSWITVALP